jgi:hypothetical protein
MPIEKQNVVKMLNHILKRILIFSFWLFTTTIIIFIKTSSKDLITELIFPYFLLILFSGFFLIFESKELKNELKLFNKIAGTTLLIICFGWLIYFLFGAAKNF